MSAGFIEQGQYVNVTGINEANKQVAVNVQSYTAPVEVTPSAGKNAMEKVTVTLKPLSSGLWLPKTWSIGGIVGSSIWTDGTNTYYSSVSDQYVLDKATGTWEQKTWNGLTDFIGDFIWTDGTDIYYSYNSNQYVLDKATSTWEQKTWNGLTSFNGSSIWTDGTNIYYSTTTDQYVLDKATSTWSQKTWTGLTGFNGTKIWTDGTDTYYSFGTDQYVLDKVTSTWSQKTWNGLTDFNGTYTWTDETDIYYSVGTTHYVLDKATSTWSQKTWNGLTDFRGDFIWTDGTDVYYSNSSSNQYVLDNSIIKLQEKTVTGNGVVIPDPGYDGLSKVTVNNEPDLWVAKNWSGLTNFSGWNVWTDRTDIYCSTGTDQYVLDKSTSTWSQKTWSGLTNFYGQHIWTDGTNIYYDEYTYIPIPSPSSTSNHYILNKATDTWSQHTWYMSDNITALDVIGGNFIWQDYDNNIHVDRWISNQAQSTVASAHCVLDKTTGKWVDKTWDIGIKWQGSNIWKTSKGIYYSSASTHYVLNKDTNQFEAKVWNGLTNFYGGNVWTDGVNYFITVQNGGSYDQYVLNEDTDTWLLKPFSGYTGAMIGDNVWTDNEKIYYSNNTDQYQLYSPTRRQ